MTRHRRRVAGGITSLLAATGITLAVIWPNPPHAPAGPPLKLAPAVFYVGDHLCPAQITHAACKQQYGPGP